MQWRAYTQPSCQVHTHPFNGPLSRTTRVSRYQKGKTSLDYTEARDSEWQWHQLGDMQVCTSLQTDNHASIRPLSFLQAGCPSCRPTNSVKALKARALKASTRWDRILEICMARYTRYSSLRYTAYINHRGLHRGFPPSTVQITSGASYSYLYFQTSQPRSITALYIKCNWTVFIFHSAEGRRLSWPIGG